MRDDRSLGKSSMKLRGLFTAQNWAESIAYKHEKVTAILKFLSFIIYMTINKNCWLKLVYGSN